MPLDRQMAGPLEQFQVVRGSLDRVGDLPKQRHSQGVRRVAAFDAAPGCHVAVRYHGGPRRIERVEAGHQVASSERWKDDPPRGLKEARELEAMALDKALGVG